MFPYFIQIACDNNSVATQIINEENQGLLHVLADIREDYRNENKYPFVLDLSDTTSAVEFVESLPVTIQQNRPDPFDEKLP